MIACAVSLKGAQCAPKYSEKKKNRQSTAYISKVARQIEYLMGFRTPIASALSGSSVAFGFLAHVRPRLSLTQALSVD